MGLSKPSKRNLLVVMTAIIAFALPATSALAGGFAAHLSAVNHTPVANTKWRLTVTATRGHQKLSGTASYRYPVLRDGCRARYRRQVPQRRLA